jgi:hypothetical protein
MRFEDSICGPLTYFGCEVKILVEEAFPPIEGAARPMGADSSPDSAPRAAMAGIRGLRFTVD